MMLIDNIKESEGFVDHVYQDSLGIDTIGYGTKMPLTEKECELLLIHRLDKLKDDIFDKKSIVILLSEDRQDVILEMCYQMGVRGVLNFKMMWKAIEQGNYSEASKQMLDSKWAIQTPQRANKLASIMQG